MKINTTSALVSGAALMVLASAPLAAQELHYGGQVTVSLPASGLGNSDFLDSKVGGGVGAHMLIGFSGGHALVPRVDYTAYKNSGNGDAKAQMFQAGVDYDYYISRKVNDGFYLGAGVGYGSTKFQQNTPLGQLNDTPDNVYGAAQVGYMFTPNLGVEVRYTYAQYKPEFNGSKASIDAPTANASFVFRF